MSETLCRRRRSPNGSISTYQSILLSEMSILAFWIFFETGQKVEDLFVDLRDGYALIALLEALTGERIQKENGFTRFHRIQNVQYCLDFLKKKNVSFFFWVFWAENDPDLAENSPNLAENGPNLAENGSNLAENGPNLAENDPNLAESDPNLAGNGPNLTENGPNLA
ncbi:hypothetical protein B9Z55_003486 [Caenorhabditis nigoni]|uniref:Calponin-homology (CH) domain-containing protein n=1 Tax=Caenorhabditis nigoni TaxID=1611254 RepID=A0A2G5VQP9_9PELO|nr:hypothetical protein B9Z55_003486 [Caenorhabditis nigoni]